MTSYIPPPISAPLGDVTTDRLELRRFRSDDIDGLTAVFAKPEVWQFPHGRAFTRNETRAFLHKEMQCWDECGFGLWAAIQRTDERIIGYVGLSVPMFLPEILPAVEIGWRLDPTCWGQGLATEGARAALREGFDTLGLDEIVCIFEAANTRSVNVAERLGMKFDRVASLPGRDQREPLDVQCYHLTRHQWETTNRTPTPD